MKRKHLLSIADLTPEEVSGLISKALQMKRKPHLPVLRGKSIIMIFEKPSLRTRVSFEIAISQLGGHCIYLRREEVGMGSREPVADVARILSRYASAMIVRTFAQSTLETLAKHASIPIINALSDEEHPCQALADLMTIYEKRGTLKGMTIAYIGDGNNVATSIALASASVGANFIIASPKGYEIPKSAWEKARRRSLRQDAWIKWVESPQEAAREADVIYTDVWISMGQEEAAKHRLEVFSPYQVNEALLALAKEGAIFMHPLPAHPGQEISEGLLEHPRSVVFDQAENRLYIQKAILREILGV